MPDFLGSPLPGIPLSLRMPLSDAFDVAYVYFGKT